MASKPVALLCGGLILMVIAGGALWWHRSGGAVRDMEVTGASTQETLYGYRMYSSDDEPICPPADLPLGRLIDRLDGAKMSFRGSDRGMLPLEIGSVENLSVVHQGRSTFFVYQENFGGEGRTGICRFDDDMKRRRWCQDTRVMIPEVALHGDALYLFGYGSFAKFALFDGRLIWEAERGTQYSFFKHPTFEGDKIVVYASERHNGPFDRLVLQKQTGLLIGFSRADTGSFVAQDFSFHKAVCPK